MCYHNHSGFTLPPKLVIINYHFFAIKSSTIG
jgi:hypothetical protein